jgi:hypothetical protein
MWRFKTEEEFRAEYARPDDKEPSDEDFPARTPWHKRVPGSWGSAMDGAFGKTVTDTLVKILQEHNVVGNFTPGTIFEGKTPEHWLHSWELSLEMITLDEPDLEF